MKKICITLILTALTFCGCSDKTETTAPESQTETVTEAPSDVQESAVQSPTKAAQRISPEAGIYVYDFTGLVSDEEITQCNEYAAQLNSEYGISAGVAFVENLGGASPYDYAETCYKDLFSTAPNGMLVLINNDSNEDVIYKTGVCNDYISDRAESEAFYYATKEIVAGNYKNAAMKLLELGTNCPASGSTEEDSAE